MAFRLTITSGKGQGRELDFTRDVIKIGRLADNDLVLYEPGVSRYHCEILKEDSRYTLRDVGSSNGTLLNGVLTTEAELSEGDRLQLGPITFQFHAGVEVPESRRRLTGGQAAVARPESTAVRREIEQDQTAALSRKELQALREKAEQERSAGVEPKADARAQPEANAEAKAGAGADSSRSASQVPRSANWAADAVGVARPRGLTAASAKLRVQQWLAGVSPRMRMVLVAAVALLVIVPIAAILLGGPRDRSQEIFPLNTKTAALRFGVGRVDVVTPDHASFSFAYEDGRAELTYTGGGVDSEDEVTILLNGQSVGHMQKASSWTPGFRQLLPKRLLKAGINIVTFDNVRVPGSEERWGVTQVQVLQAPLPQPDPDKARQLFDLGIASFDTRKVTPQNLYRAISYLQQAALHLEGLEVPPPLASEIATARHAAERELQTVHDDLMFAARRAQRFGNHAEAVESLRQLLRYYPDASDPRHQEVKRLLSDMVGDANR